MKIIQVMPEFGLAGAEIMCENLTYELEKLGHTVIVLSMFEYHSAITERLEQAGIDIRYLGKKPGLDISVINKMRRIFAQEKPDVIHTHRYVMQYAIPAAVLAGVKVRVHTVHNVATKEVSALPRKLHRFFFHFLHVIPVALSKNVKQTIIEEYKLADNKVPVVFNGIDLSRCKAKESYACEGVFKIIHVGRFQEAKNHLGLLEAFEIFNKKRRDSELHFIGDGEKKAFIEQVVKEKGLADKVIFHGLQADVHKFLSDMDVFTLPSLYEGMPMSIIEAMGTGLPIIATKVGGIPDMLNSNCAILVPVDVSAIADAFEKYYCNEDLRKTHGTEALKLSDRFSAETMAKNYVNIYINAQ